MTDDSFAKAGRWAAYAAAALSLLYAVTLAAGSRGDGVVATVASAAAGRVLNSAGSWLLAATGLAMSIAVAALAGRRCSSARWMWWAGAMGVLGAALTTIHGLYDAYRVPVLLAQWALDDPGRQAAISAFAGVPNAVDPKGTASLLFAGLFALTAASVVTGPHLYRRLGWIHGAALVAAFIAGAVGVVSGLVWAHLAYLVVAWLSFAVTGPLWWIAVARLPED